jgi:HK97 family phage prohead protease
MGHEDNGHRSETGGSGDGVERLFMPSEVRVVDPTAAELRALRDMGFEDEADDTPGVVEGLAIPYGVRSQLLGRGSWSFYETVMPGAATASLAERADRKYLVEHDSRSLLGRTKNGMLTVTEDASGVRVRNVLPPTNLGRDTAQLVKRGDYDGHSFGFYTQEDRWTHFDPDDERPDERELVEIDPFEFTVTSDAAYTQTTIGLEAAERSLMRSMEARGADPGRVRALRARLLLAEHGVGHGATEGGGR